MKSARAGNNSGFTLVEVIVALVVAAAVATALVPLMSRSLTQSGMPVHRAKNAAEVEQSLEGVVAAYVAQENSSPSTALATIASNIDAGTYGTDPAITYNWVTYDSSGAETDTGVAGDTLKVTASKGGYSMCMLLATTRPSASDPAVAY